MKCGIFVLKCDTQTHPIRMSMFFFRLHNLQREEENKKKKKAELSHRRGARVFRRISRGDLSHLTAPSRLFEKTPMNPSDSLDEIALQIPRYLYEAYVMSTFNLFSSNEISLMNNQVQLISSWVKELFPFDITNLINENVGKFLNFKRNSFRENKELV